MNKAIFILILITTGIACGESPMYENSLELQDKVWSYDQIFSSTFSIKDTSKSYDLLLDVAHGTEYKFQNLYVDIATIFPNKKIANSELSLDFADKKGKWKGDCNSNKCNLRFYLQQSFKFKEPGEYKIDVSQYSRNNRVEFLESLTLSLFMAK